MLRDMPQGIWCQSRCLSYSVLSPRCHLLHFSIVAVVQSLSHVSLWTPYCSTLNFPVLHHLWTNSCPLSKWCHPTISSSVIPFSACPQSIPASQGLFQWISSLYQLAKMLELQLQHQSSQWISGLISFKIDWFDLLAVLGTLKSLLQLHSSKALILWCSAFFMVQLSYPYMTNENTIASTTWTFVGKVMSLLFNTLSRFVIAFLPRSKHVLTSWLQSHLSIPTSFNF